MRDLHLVLVETRIQHRGSLDSTCSSGVYKGWQRSARAVRLTVAFCIKLRDLPRLFCHVETNVIRVQTSVYVDLYL